MTMISGDAMMDVIATLSASKNRCRNMDRLKGDQRGCEACGRLLKPGVAALEIQTDIGRMPFGPECAKKIAKALKDEPALQAAIAAQQVEQRRLDDAQAQARSFIAGGFSPSDAIDNVRVHWNLTDAQCVALTEAVSP